MGWNWDLILAILLYAEKRHNSNDTEAYALQITDLPPKFHDIPVAGLKKHLDLLVEQGLVAAVPIPPTYAIGGLAMHVGHFLDHAKIPAVWDATKKIAGNKSFEEFRSTLHQLAGAYEGGKLADVERRLLSGDG